MEYIGWFIFSFILVYIIYYIFSIRKARRGVKVPSEVQCLITLYKLDVNKFSYWNFTRVVGLVTSLDIALVATVVTKVNGIVWQILFGFVAVVPVVVLSFILLGKYYQKKQTKDNKKELEKEKKYLEKLDNKKKKKEEKKEKKKTKKVDNKTTKKKGK